jgi:hypothetical protein
MFNLIKIAKRLTVITIAILPFAAKAQTGSKEWITKSNSYTKTLIDIDEKYSPEFGSDQGLAYYDTLIAVPTLANRAAERKDRLAVVAALKKGKQTETSLAVKQDLDILINQSELGFRQDDFGFNKEVSFMNATATIFGGLQGLLDDQTPAERRASAIIRLRKYAGLDKRYEPLVAIYKDRTLKQMAKPDMIYPSKQQMEVDLSRNATMVSGIEELFKKYKLTGWEDAYATIKKQLEDYDAWVTASLLPKGRTDFRLPADEYKLALEGYGVDIPPAQLAKMAHAAFTDIQNQMRPIAAQVAKKHTLPSSDYRDVIKYLKKDQIIGDSIMPLYKRHLADIEAIIREHHLVTLPNRPAIIRLASEAETAQGPAPHMVPPPFLNNTGQRGVFVLPLNMPAAPGKAVDKYDDFTFDAASWTLIAHEARPATNYSLTKWLKRAFRKPVHCMLLIQPM